MAKYYRLADSRGADGVYRHCVAVTFDLGVPNPVGVWTTDGYRENYGGFFTAVDALRYAEIFGYADGLWILPYVEQLAAGERVFADEVVKRYRKLHGSYPDTFEH